MLALVAFLFVTPLLAQVPDATIQRLAEISVQNAEIHFLWSTSQIDGTTRSEREKPLDAEYKTLMKQVQQFPSSVQQQAQQQINGIAQTRLSLLQPQWQKQADAAKLTKDQHEAALYAAIPEDARAALEFQRKRLVLQKRRDDGVITPEAFAEEDKKALDAIAILRNKYELEGHKFALRFDGQLKNMTEALANSPDTQLPVSRVPAGESGTSTSDYNKDVALAADLTIKRNDLAKRYAAKQMDSAAFRETDKILGTDVIRLSDKWTKAGRGDAFDRDYKSRAANNGNPVKPQPPRPSGNGMPSLDDFLLALAFPVGLYLLYKLIILIFRKEVPVPVVKISTNYGTAAFQRVSDVALGNPQTGIFLGQSSTPPDKSRMSQGGGPVLTTPESHTLIVARTRSGKGTRVIVPTLLRYEMSMLVIDPKGENAAISARIRRDVLKQTVHIVNPWSLHAETYERGGFTQATYNPLDILHHKDPNVVAVAQALAGAICSVSKDGKDQFWEGSAGSILTAVLLWLTDQPRETKTLGRAREITSLSRAEFTEKFLTKMVVSEAFDGAIRENSAPVIDMPPETYGGVMATLAKDMRFLSDQQIKKVTASSSFSMTDLVLNKVSVFVVIPMDRMETQKTWLRLMLAAATHTFRSYPLDQRPMQRCLFFIDEFASLGHMGEFPGDIATMSGFGVDYAIAVQGLDQLKDHYGEARGTILGNCGYKWFCNVGELDTAKWLSDTLGKKTVRTETTSQSKTASTRSASEGESVSHSEIGRSLLNPDEILSLGRDVAIAFPPNGKPHFLATVDYWSLQQAFSFLQESDPKLFWQPPFEFDPNPYHQEAAREKSRAVGQSGTPSAGPSQA
jgi:type IV secretion system protein VirD4